MSGSAQKSGRMRHCGDGYVATVPSGDGGACTERREILFDKFHVMRHLGEALDAGFRKSEYGRLAGRDRRYIKGQKYTLLSRKENLTLRRQEEH